MACRSTSCRHPLHHPTGLRPKARNTLRNTGCQTHCHLPVRALGVRSRDLEVHDGNRRRGTNKSGSGRLGSARGRSHAGDAPQARPMIPDRDTHGYRLSTTDAVAGIPSAAARPGTVVDYGHRRNSGPGSPQCRQGQSPGTVRPVCRPPGLGVAAGQRSLQGRSKAALGRGRAVRHSWLAGRDPGIPGTFPPAVVRRTVGSREQGLPACSGRRCGSLTGTAPDFKPSSGARAP